MKNYFLLGSFCIFSIAFSLAERNTEHESLVAAIKRSDSDFVEKMAQKTTFFSKGEKEDLLRTAKQQALIAHAAHSIIDCCKKTGSMVGFIASLGLAIKTALKEHDSYKDYFMSIMAVTFLSTAGGILYNKIMNVYVSRAINRFNNAKKVNLVLEAVIPGEDIAPENIY